MSSLQLVIDALRVSELSEENDPKEEERATQSPELEGIFPVRVSEEEKLLRKRDLSSPTASPSILRLLRSFFQTGQGHSLLPALPQTEVPAPPG